MMPPVISAVLAPAGNVLRENRSCLLAQRANAAQPAKKTPRASIIPQCRPSAPGATVMAESPSNPSKLTPAQAIEVVRTVFMVFRLTINIRTAVRILKQVF
jgi:hypothetical protein